MEKIKVYLQSSSAKVKRQAIDKTIYNLLNGIEMDVRWEELCQEAEGRTIVDSLKRILQKYQDEGMYRNLWSMIEEVKVDNASLLALLSDIYCKMPQDLKPSVVEFIRSSKVKNGLKIHFLLCYCNPDFAKLIIENLLPGEKYDVCNYILSGLSCDMDVSALDVLEAWVEMKEQFSPMGMAKVVPKLLESEGNEKRRRDIIFKMFEKFPKNVDMVVNRLHSFVFNDSTLFSIDDRYALLNMLLASVKHEDDLKRLVDNIPTFLDRCWIEEAEKNVFPLTLVKDSLFNCCSASKRTSFVYDIINKYAVSLINEQDFLFAYPKKELCEYDAEDTEVLNFKLKLLEHLMGQFEASEDWGWCGSDAFEAFVFLLKMYHYQPESRESLTSLMNILLGKELIGFSFYYALQDIFRLIREEAKEETTKNWVARLLAKLIENEVVDYAEDWVALDDFCQKERLDLSGYVEGYAKKVEEFRKSLAAEKEVVGILQLPE